LGTVSSCSHVASLSLPFVPTVANYSVPDSGAVGVTSDHLDPVTCLGQVTWVLLACSGQKVVGKERVVAVRQLGVVVKIGEVEHSRLACSSDFRLESRMGRDRVRMEFRRENWSWDHSLDPQQAQHHSAPVLLEPLLNNTVHIDFHTVRLPTLGSRPAVAVVEGRDGRRGSWQRRVGRSGLGPHYSDDTRRTAAGPVVRSRWGTSPLDTVIVT
jgi:hypothetical protein